MNYKETLAMKAAATRTCETCGRVFRRNDKPGIVYSNFMKLRFCSRECSNTAIRLDPIENFWGKVERGDGCWNWTGGLSPKGYGVHWVGNGHKRAHRYSYELATGIDPAEKVVMHTCDNRRCVNPAHLVLGSQTDNVADMDRKGRRGKACGAFHPSTRLSAEQALAIRHDPRPAKAVAADYPIGVSGVEAIRAGRTWRHL